MNLARFPRRRYTQGQTPIEKLSRLSAMLGGPTLYMKRDDLFGLTAGGSKTRKLEFLVAEALAQGADTLITGGAVQSNHCRLTLAAAVREGMKCRLILEERIAEAPDPAARRAELVRSYEEQFNNPYFAASLRTIDEIIRPKETRRRTPSSLRRLRTRRKRDSRRSTTISLCEGALPRI